MWGDLLSLLADDARERLDRVMIERTLKVNDVLFWEGEAGDAMYVIDAGHILVERVTEQGDTVAVAVLGPDSIVGEQALIGERTGVNVRGATARAVTNTTVRSLGRAQFDELRRTQGVFDGLLVNLLDSRIRELNDLVLEARHRPADDRVKRRLVELIELFGPTIPLTQATLAALAGTTRPTTNGVLRALQDARVLELGRGRVVILRPEALQD
ncbi:MAG: Crp/Fnr family transcriptional regulator [Actinomycetota bacterium]